MKRQLVALAGIVVLTAGPAMGYDWYTHGKWYAREPAKDFYLSKLLAEIRIATRRYLDVEQAKADGYTQISGNVPLVGYYFYKAGIARFDYASAGRVGDHDAAMVAAGSRCPRHPHGPAAHSVPRIECKETEQSS